MGEQEKIDWLADHLKFDREYREVPEVKEILRQHVRSYSLGNALVLAAAFFKFEGLYG